MGMSYEQLLLLKLAEEASEVAHAALKASQFGLGTINPSLNKTSLEVLQDELNDVLGVVELLKQETEFNFEPNQKAMEAKIKKIKMYLDYSINLGRVTL